MYKNSYTKVATDIKMRETELWDIGSRFAKLSSIYNYLKVGTLSANTNFYFYFFFFGTFYFDFLIWGIHKELKNSLQK